jgi:hypothetical protein
MFKMNMINKHGLGHAKTCAVSIRFARKCINLLNMLLLFHFLHKNTAIPDSKSLRTKQIKQKVPGSWVHISWEIT